jgi:hypothetical protein
MMLVSMHPNASQEFPHAVLAYTTMVKWEGTTCCTEHDEEKSKHY